MSTKEYDAVPPYSEEELPDELWTPPRKKNILLSRWKDIALLILTGIIILLSILYFQETCPFSISVSKFTATTTSVPSAASISPYTGISSATEHWTPYFWFTKYSKDKNGTTTDEVWDGIRPAQGVVALDNSFAKAQNLPPSIPYPADWSKSVYIIDAYHQMHCLTVIRKTFYEILNSQPTTYPPSHSKHCFDALRQYIMCTAGDTPLYTHGTNITGDGQFRKCRDWGALRDWTEANSACYVDTQERISLGEHFGRCEETRGRGDGLEVVLGV